MIRLDAGTVLLQWATGGLFFLWVTTRRREVGIGYGWLLRGVFAVMAVGAFGAGRFGDAVPVRDACSLLGAAGALVAAAVSVARRRAGVRGQREVQERRSARVAAMTGADVETDTSPPAPGRPPAEVKEFPPALDLMAPAFGLVGLVAGAAAAGGPTALAVVRTVAGAGFLGAVTDAMLLGHWYLVQPGLGRDPILQLNRGLAILWPVEVGALLWPTGMVSVLDGTIRDGYGGILAWFWVACAVTTLGLCFVTAKALQEKAYSAVMAATGLLYLAILTAFGTDLVARLVLKA